MDENTTRLYRIRRTALQMLADRGYLVTEGELAMSRDGFREKFGDEPRREDLDFNKSKKDDVTDEIYVFFPDDPKVGVKAIKTYVERMKSNNVSRAIMVVQQNLTPFAKSCVQEMAPKYLLEIFQEVELLVNINKHILVPKHEVMTPAEKAALLLRYTVKEAQLPRMQLSDPVARYFGLQRGQVVRITRPSETAGKYITYRYVF
eukprot:TRINITY_DN1134_c0_g1_i1.p1 TRINITY_DN1134_c0_g1~~TRINITY_DN1134_c0_g1_i1.p1  ORF type:complete len:204 (+),score=48.74 TRINITY_DN1134_c0_g1_i1:357-968(+)